jgi:ABC-2 type transport system permease protein
MFRIYWHFVKEKALTVSIYLLSMIAFVELYISLYPSMAQQAQQVSKVVEKMPKGFMEAFGVNVTQLSFSHLEDLLASKHFGLIWPLIVIILSISLANAALAGEVENGTLAVALAQPISRLKIYMARFLGGVTWITAFVLGSILCIFPLASLHNITFSVTNNLNLAWSGLAFGIAVYSVCYFASALFSAKARASILVSGVFLLMYILNVVAALKSSLVDIRYGSFFYYFSANTELTGNFVKWEFWVFGLSALAFFAIGALVFINRDVEV